MIKRVDNRSVVFNRGALYLSEIVISAE